MNHFVLDASVAAKCYLPSNGETLVPEALSLVEDFSHGLVQLSVPDLFWVETGSIFRKAVRSGRMSQKGAEQAVQNLSELDFPTTSSLPLLMDAFAIASLYQRTVYDSIYIALAVACGRPLVTADERLVNALAAYFPVRWLGSLC